MTCPKPSSGKSKSKDDASIVPGIRIPEQPAVGNCYEDLETVVFVSV